MAISGELKVGDKIKPIQSSTWSLVYGKAEVKHLATNDQGREFAWLLVKEGVGSNRNFNTVAVSALKEGWERVDSFFRIGKKYKSVHQGIDPTIYDIHDLYSVENPSWEGEGQAAIAMVTRNDGTSYVTILNETNFPDMVEVK